MSNQAVVNPEELKRFADNLRRVNETVKDQQRQLRGHFSRLSESWRDNEFSRFEEKFKDAMKALDKYLQSSDEHVPRLLKKAKAAEDYVNQKM